MVSNSMVGDETARDYGERLGLAEYERRLTALYSDAPASPDRMQTLALDRAEFDLVIDHRLGVKFPRERRDALWAIQERIRNRRGLIILRSLIAKVLARRPFDYPTAADTVKAEYSKVLDRDELRRFFGVEDAVGRRS